MQSPLGSSSHRIPSVRRPRPNAVHQDSLPLHRVETTLRAARFKRREIQRAEARQAFDDAIVAYFFPRRLDPISSDDSHTLDPARWNSCDGHGGGGVFESSLAPYTPPVPESPPIRHDDHHHIEQYTQEVPSDAPPPMEPTGFELVRETRAPTTADPLGTILSWIGMLPIELLITVFQDLSNHGNSVLAITHTCRQWRTVALDMPFLFISGICWDKWPIWLLEEWIGRTKGQPMLVELSTLALVRMRDEPRFINLVRFSQPRWESLDVSITPLEDDPDPRCLGPLFEFPMNCLSTLKIWGRGCPPAYNLIDIPRHHLPNLRHLTLQGLLLVASNPRNSMTSKEQNSFPILQDIRVEDVLTSHHRWNAFFSSTRNASRIEISGSRISDPEIIQSSVETGPVTLTNLQHISFQDSTSIIGLTMLQCCFCPNLTYLGIHGGLSLSSKLWSDVVSV